KLRFSLKVLHDLGFELIVAALFEHLFDEDLFAVLLPQGAEGGAKAASGNRFFYDVALSARFDALAGGKQALAGVFNFRERGLPQLPSYFDVILAAATGVTKQGSRY
ncbi:MAG: hypothetical protein KDD39_15885, partial [Bdellovibrionales bacterium]|nr:hypothetical protein [Bdellovibrionales bacterium]